MVNEIKIMSYRDLFVLFKEDEYIISYLYKKGYKSPDTLPYLNQYIYIKKYININPNILDDKDMLNKIIHMVYDNKYELFKYIFRINNNIINNLNDYSLRWLFRLTNVFQLLVNNNIYINSPIITNHAIYNNYDIVKYLIKIGYNNFDEVSLYQAIKTNDVKNRYKMVKYILLNYNITNTDSNIIREAIYTKDLTLVNFIIKHLKNIKYDNVLYAASEVGINMFNKIINYDYDLESGYDGNTIILSAVKNNNIKLTKYLIRKGVNCNVFNDDGYGLYYYALKNQNLKMIKLVCENVTNINTFDKYGNPHHFIIFNRFNKIIIDYLFSIAKFNPNLTNKYGRTFISLLNKEQWLSIPNKRLHITNLPYHLLMNNIINESEILQILENYEGDLIYDVDSNPDIINFIMYKRMKSLFDYIIDKYDIDKLFYKVCYKFIEDDYYFNKVICKMNNIKTDILFNIITKGIITDNKILKLHDAGIDLNLLNEQGETIIGASNKSFDIQILNYMNTVGNINYHCFNYETIKDTNTVDRLIEMGFDFSNIFDKNNRFVYNMNTDILWYIISKFDMVYDKIESNIFTLTDSFDIRIKALIDIMNNKTNVLFNTDSNLIALYINAGVQLLKVSKDCYNYKMFYDNIEYDNSLIIDIVKKYSQYDNIFDYINHKFDIDELDINRTLINRFINFIYFDSNYDLNLYTYVIYKTCLFNDNQLEYFSNDIDNIMINMTNNINFIITKYIGKILFDIYNNNNIDYIKYIYDECVYFKKLNLIDNNKFDNIKIIYDNHDIKIDEPDIPTDRLSHIKLVNLMMMMNR